MPDRLSPLHGPEPVRPLPALAGVRVLAVAALAAPEPFLTHLRDAGARVEAVLHRDHHAYDAADAASLLAAAAGRPLVMTRKDAVKLRPLLPAGTEAYVLEQTVTVEHGGEALDCALRRACGVGDS